jgi:hypothetical protein
MTPLQQPGANPVEEKACPAQFFRPIALAGLRKRFIELLLSDPSGSLGVRCKL